MNKLVIWLERKGYFLLIILYYNMIVDYFPGFDKFIIGLDRHIPGFDRFMADLLLFYPIYLQYFGFNS